MKKKNIGLIIAIIVIAIVVVAVGTLAVLYFVTDLFKSEQQLFWKYLGDDSSITSILNNENQIAQQKLKEENSYTSIGNLNISAGGQKADVGVVTTSRHDKNTNRTYADITLKKGENDIIKGSYINSGDVYAIQCKNIYEHYIGIRNNDLKTFAKNLGLEDEVIANIPDSIKLATLESMLQIDEEISNHITETYSNVILESIPKGQYKKIDNVKVGDKGYELYLNETVLNQVILNFLNTLKNDSTTINYVKTKMSSGAQGEISNEQIIETIDNAINKLQSERIDINILIQVYAQKGKTIKVGITLGNAEGQIKIDIDSNNINMDLSNLLNSEEPINEITQISINKQKLQNNSIQETMTITMINADDQMQNIELTSILGEALNNQINNSYTMAVKGENNGTQVTMAEINYDTQIVATSQVEEITELNNTNTVIINNYPIEKLVPFFEAISAKTEKVFENVMNQL